MDDAVVRALWDQIPALIFVLGLRVTDVAVAPDARPLYEAMVVVGEQLGFTEIVTKDGTRLGFHYQAATCNIDGATYYIAAGFVDSAPS